MEYKILDEYPQYKIYPDGKVYSIKLKKYIDGHKNKRGYYAFTLYNLEGKRKHKGLHQLLAMAFIPNPNNYEIVRHLDDNKDNNCLSNLKWGTIKENIEDAIRNNVFKIPDNSKRWLVKVPNGDTIEVDSLSRFCLEHNLSKQNLHKTYMGDRNHHKNYQLLRML
jgi:hypothetical protein